MSFRALLFTYEEQTAADVTSSSIGLPIDWIFAASPHQAAALIAQAELDLAVIDCDSIAGRELSLQAQGLKQDRTFKLLCLSTGEAGIAATTLQKPIDNKTLTHKLREALPLFS